MGRQLPSSRPSEQIVKLFWCFLLDDFTFLDDDVPIQIIFDAQCFLSHLDQFCSFLLLHFGVSLLGLLV
jgi:hypothetical protein